MTKISTRLQQWMYEFYGWSSDKFNKESKLNKEFRDLRNIIIDIKVLEGKKDE